MLNPCWQCLYIVQRGQFGAHGGVGNAQSPSKVIKNPHNDEEEQYLKEEFWPQTRLSLKNTYFTDKSLSESKVPSVGQRMELCPTLLSLPVLISCCGFPQSVGRHSPLLFCWNLETRIFDRLGGFSVKIAFCLIVEFWAFDKKHV